MADGAIEVKLSLKGRPIREFVFSEPRVMIGRDPQSHIVLDNPGISRCHAELVREEDGFYINDQESANGTFLNDVPVTRSHLKDGDRIRIGRQVDGRAESFEREPDGGDIPCAVRDNGDLAHKTPLVLGTVSPSMRMACRRARPKAL